MTHKIAVLIPCYNEEKTIASVISDFRSQLPEASIYVYDNNSKDRTANEASVAGAIVRSEKRQGKGNVIRSMFAQIDADIYIMVDGDGTYPADRVHDLIKPIIDEEADMVNGSRLHSLSQSNFKLVNWIGNKIFLFILNYIFKIPLTDLLTGYRAFNKSIVKSIPILSRGFDVETEMTLKAIERGYKIVEVPVDLSTRPEGSSSKIRIVKDGLLICNTLFSLFRDYKPFTIFGLFGLCLCLIGLIPGSIVISEYLLTGYIKRMPSAVLATGLVLSGLLTIFTGFVVHTISRRFQELDCQVKNLIETILKKE